MAIKQEYALTRAEFDEALIRLRLNVSEVSRETGISRSYCSEFRNGDRHLRPEHLAKLKDYFESKGLVFEYNSPKHEEPDAEILKAAAETFSPKRMTMQVSDAVSDETLLSTFKTMAENDDHLVKLLTTTIVRDEALFGTGELSEETLEGLRESFSLLAANYLLMRSLMGWPQIGLIASNINPATDSVLGLIMNQAIESFKSAGLITEPQTENEEVA
ncbi:hypothetical protein GALL_256470 [mine drainage metagenome]|uniref:HTH cro/C1-type domain-containing protein n=1 Tax=mine drainage metagenome TaxID=410659 RepID=A0A1J5RAV2_9ZZZZ